MEHTRRKVLTGIGAAIAIGAGAPQAFGQESDTPEFQVLEVSSADEYVVFVNMTTAEVDLSGWTVDFEYGSDGSSEQGTIPNGTTVGARDTIKIASGAGETSGDAVVIEDPFDEKVIDTTVATSSRSSIPTATKWPTAKTTCSAVVTLWRR